MSESTFCSAGVYGVDMRISRLLAGSIAFVALLTIAGCGTRFPTDKFSRSEGPTSHTLIFFPDGRWEAFLDGNLLTFGQYETDGEQITFLSDQQCKALGLGDPVVYDWTFVEDTLTFEPAGADACADRIERLTGGAYQRTP